MVYCVYMTDIFSGIILGAVQGLTEFLPVSSSGHLIIVREIFGFDTTLGLSFDILLHFATSLAVLIYFRNDFIRLFKTALAFFRPHTRKHIEQKDKYLLYALVLGTIPAVVVGLLFENYIEATFRSVELISTTLIIGAVIFYFAEKYARKTKALTPKKGFVIGLFQALALIPGMSRSGMTISGGLFLGLTREEAARFGFLLAFPVIFGIGIKKILEFTQDGTLFILGIPALVGALTAFAVGLLVIHYLLKYLKNHTLMVFIVYRVVLAMALLLFVV